MLKNIGLTTNISVLPDENIQPNAVGLNIDRVWEIGTDEFYIGIDKKQHRKDTKEIFPDSTGEWLLEAGKKYQFDTSHWVAIPEGFAGWLIPRSTLNRNGISITSGLYDSDSTYNQHYVGKKEVQTIDVWETLGSIDTTCRDTAIKYLMRYGKKGGHNRKDLLKAVHYIVLLAHFTSGDDNGN